MSDPKKTHIPPKVFISYSWTSPEYEETVLELATRLRNDGIDIVLDKWELKEGQDKYHFMEQMVKSDDVKKVLLLCDKKYKEKADSRKGGVGTESQIISQEIYNNVSQEKFIPIVMKRDESGKEYLPVFVKNRIFVDLSDDERYEQGYERLIRNLLNQPLYKKPELGVPPAHIFEDREALKITLIKKRFFNKINTQKPKSEIILQDFLNAILDSLKDYQIDKSQSDIPYDDLIYNLIVELRIVRDEFIEFTDRFVQTAESDNFQKHYIKFFEKLYEFSNPPEEIRRFQETDYDHYKFLIKELIIYYVSILYKYEKYRQIHLFLHNTFFLKSRSYGNAQEGNYTKFYFYIRSIDEYRRNRLNSRIVSLSSEISIQNIHPSIDKLLYTSIDLLLHYYASIYSIGNWFPATYIYLPEGTAPIFMQRIKSQKYFNEIKSIFDVKDKDRFIELINKYKHYRGYSEIWYSIPDIRKIVTPDDIAKYD